MERARVGRMAKVSFAEKMKRHQLSWALANGVTPDMLETRRGKLSWVLKEEHREQNLFDPRWWRYIAGHEHRWVRALNSSQCFAVNVLAPLAEDGDLAKKVWARVYPYRPLDPADTVTVEFEHTPPCAHVWLGESGQQTQVDVFFTVQRNDIPVGREHTSRQSSTRLAAVRPSVTRGYRQRVNHAITFRTKLMRWGIRVPKRVVAGFIAAAILRSNLSFATLNRLNSSRRRLNALSTRSSNAAMPYPRLSTQRPIGSASQTRGNISRK